MSLFINIINPLNTDYLFLLLLMIIIVIIIIIIIQFNSIIIIIQFLPHKKHNTFPPQSPAGQGCLGKQSLFTVRTIWNTQIHCVGRMQGFRVLKQVVHIMTTGL
jgi:Na+/proline symporter